MIRKTILIISILNFGCTNFSEEISKEEYEVLSVILNFKFGKEDFKCLVHPPLMDKNWYGGSFDDLKTKLNSAVSKELILSMNNAESKVILSEQNLIIDKQNLKIELAPFPERLARFGNPNQVHILFSVIGKDEKTQTAVVKMKAGFDRLNAWNAVYLLKRGDAGNYEILEEKILDIS